MSLKHLLTVLLLLGVLGAVLFIPSLIDNPSHQIDEYLSYSACNLNDGECVHQTSLYGDITVSVKPREFTALEPLEVVLTSTKLNITDVIISLDGKDMFMGVNQAVLNKQTTTGQWVGTITVPVCTVDTDMEWLFSVTLKGLKLNTERIVFNVKSKH